MSKPVGILLAAGLSTRFGSNKLLYPLADQTPMVVQAARKLIDVIPQSVAVVARHDTQTAGWLEELGFEIVLNTRPEAGMARSLACGVRASHDAEGWLITLGDMPWIDKRTIRRIAGAQHYPQDIVAPLYGDRRGHPVGFGKAYVRDLLSLEGDTGARRTLEIHRQHLRLIPVDDPAVLRDVDYPEDISGTEY